MSFKGDLKSLPLASILQLLGDDQKTGMLQLNNNSTEVRIFLKNGVIVHASSSEKEYRLGSFLKNSGLITDEKLRSFLKIAKERGRPLGSVLVDNGFISKESLKKLLHDQVKEILYSVFLWKNGGFQYKDMTIKVDDKLVTEINTMEIVLEATRRIDELSVIQEHITSDNMVFRRVKKSKDKQELKINKQDKKILSLVDGRRSVKDVIRKSGYDSFTAYKILYSLLMSGEIEKDPGADQSDGESINTSDIASIYTDIIQVVSHKLKELLGTAMYGILEECKENMGPIHRSMFRGFDPSNSKEANAEAVLEMFRALDSPKRTNKILIQSYNKLLLALLQKESKILGTPITQDTLQEILQILSFAKHYDEGKNEKLMIVEQIKKTLAEASADIDGSMEKKGKPGELSSLFKNE